MTAPAPLQSIRDLFESDAFEVGCPISSAIFDALRDALLVSTTVDGPAISPTAEAILAERLRQPAEEVYDAEHDDLHGHRELVWAGQGYLRLAIAQLVAPYDHEVIVRKVGQPPEFPQPPAWPWAPKYWKPSPDPMRNLERGCALLAAAGDVIKRKAGAGS